MGFVVLMSTKHVSWKCFNVKSYIGPLANYTATNQYFVVVFKTIRFLLSFEVKKLMLLFKVMPCSRNEDEYNCHSFRVCEVIETNFKANRILQPMVIKILLY